MSNKICLRNIVSLNNFNFLCPDIIEAIELSLVLKNTLILFSNCWLYWPVKKMPIQNDEQRD